MEDIIRLNPFESRAIISLGSIGPGVYLQKLATIGNSLLSTVYVESLDLGASVHVEYFDYGSGPDAGEIYPLSSHAVLTSTGSNRIEVFNHHDKPTVKATVSGGTVRFGVYLTVRTSQALPPGGATSDLQIAANALISQLTPLKAGGLFSDITVGLTAVEVKVGASRLANRKLVTVFALDSKMYWGYSNTVTASNGTPIFKSQMVSWEADSTCQIWIISVAAGKHARISESP